MIKIADFHYEEVPQLGTVLFSRKALDNLQAAHVGPEDLTQALEHGTPRKAPSGAPVAGYLDNDGIRLELQTKRHLKGSAAVCVDGYRVRS